ncbi:SIR2 family protein [Tellurirhabdus rosea]|uniref:SIR2 family protein n=1 Tax=Tellurirhabdus rosea TaxID=2674997 RepID=UPI00225BDFCA|nr:SIR2 family protein [Tellurirhabdus rosea]
MQVKTIQLAEFIRIFRLKGSNIAWFTGAGASVASGLPSAYDMIWDFKRTIFCTEQNIDLAKFSNLTPVNRQMIQYYFESQRYNGCIDCPPPLDSLNEYSYYFQKAYSTLDLRADYIERKLSDAKPTYGYKVLAGLMKMGILKYIITTNFDKLIEDAAALAYQSTSKLHISTIDNNYRGQQFIQNHKTPLLIKLHGDFHSLFMKNTTDELKQQDLKLKDAFQNICFNNGMAFIGYSGRDESVMDMIEEVLNYSYSFPGGLYWFYRSGTSILERVDSLLKKAAQQNTSVFLVEIDSFEECFSSIIKLTDNIPIELKEFLETSNRRLIKNPMPNKGMKPPILRFNALEVKDFPTEARLIICEAGNTKDIQNQISLQKVNLICKRKKQGVVGFGDDRDFGKVFPENIKGLYNIEERQLYYNDSSMKDLVSESLLKALTNNRVIKGISRKGKYYIIIHPNHLTSEELIPLRNLKYFSYGKEVSHKISGTVPGTSLKWVDALEVQLVYKLSTMYLLLNPTIKVEKTENINLRFKSASFIKEEIAKRLNGPYNAILESWIKILFQDNTENKLNEKVFYAFNDISGINPSFRIVRNTSFSKSL